jgi:hypothetical protein
MKNKNFLKTTHDKYTPKFVVKRNLVLRMEVLFDNHQLLENFAQIRLVV